jgi:regulator of protease activity HflC (stomatin/prohibitin superfamily)
MKMITTKQITLVVVGFAAVVLLLLSNKVWETNNAGYMQVKQDAISGEMSVRLEPGMYYQGFANITTYNVADVYDFNSPDSQINVRFTDASVANIGGQITYRLPTTQAEVLKIHKDFRSYEPIHNNIIRQVVAAALKQSATYFTAEEVYSTRRSDFIDLVNDQIKFGIYATSYTEEWKKDENGDANLIRRVNYQSDKDGHPIVSEESAFHIYGIELIQFVVGDVDFDEKTDALIAKRKEAEQERVVAKANAERAKQDTITAVEQGKAKVALAEAAALVDKKTAVVAAEKETAIAEQVALQAEQQKRAIIAKGEADATAAKLKVAAGLSPLEKANIDKDTAIGVAAELAKVRFPQLMVIGGGSNGGAINPFDAVGLKSLIDISKDLSNGVAK